MRYVTTAVVLVAIAVVVWRFVKGWETWGHLAQAAAGLFVAGAIDGWNDGGVGEAVRSSLVTGVGGSLLYWFARPRRTPPPEPERSPRTPEQRRLWRRLGILVWIGVVAALNSFLVGISVALELLPLGAFIGCAALAAVALAVTHLTFRGLRRTGPPFDDMRMDWRHLRPRRRASKG